jgi:cytochrome c oxidase assembly factor CtaG
VVNKIALSGLLLMAAAGAWLVAAPFAERYQAAGAPWTGAALMDVAVGAIVAAVALAGFFAALAGRVRELYARAARRPEAGPDQAQ